MLREDDYALIYARGVSIAIHVNVHDVLYKYCKYT